MTSCLFAAGAMLISGLLLCGCSNEREGNDGKPRNIGRTGGPALTTITLSPWGLDGQVRCYTTQSENGWTLQPDIICSRTEPDCGVRLTFDAPKARAPGAFWPINAEVTGRFSCECYAPRAETRVDAPVTITTVRSVGEIATPEAIAGGDWKFDEPTTPDYLRVYTLKSKFDVTDGPESCVGSWDIDLTLEQNAQSVEWEVIVDE